MNEFKKHFSFAIGTQSRRVWESYWQSVMAVRELKRANEEDEEYFDYEEDDWF